METEKKIVINGSELQVIECYPYRYDFGKGKEVLKIKISENKHKFSDIKLLEQCEGAIEYKENNMLINEYKGYSLDFNCQYSGGEYNIEITRKGEQGRKIDQLEKEAEIMQSMIDDIVMGGKVV